MSPRRALALAALLLATLGPAAGQGLQPGQPLPVLATTDAHDRPWRVPPEAALLLFAADKAASDRITEALGADGAQTLATARAAVLADIHQMPALVTRLFALPALRELPYAIGLARDEALAAALPRRRGEVTLLRLQAGTVVGIEHAADVAALRRALGRPD